VWGFEHQQSHARAANIVSEQERLCRVQIPSSPLLRTAGEKNGERDLNQGGRAERSETLRVSYANGEAVSEASTSDRGSTSPPHRLLRASFASSERYGDLNPIRRSARVKRGRPSDFGSPSPPHRSTHHRKRRRHSPAYRPTKTAEDRCPRFSRPSRSSCSRYPTRARTTCRCPGA